MARGYRSRTRGSNYEHRGVPQGTRRKGNGYHPSFRQPAGAKKGRRVRGSPHRTGKPASDDLPRQPQLSCSPNCRTRQQQQECHQNRQSHLITLAHKSCVELSPYVDRLLKHLDQVKEHAHQRPGTEDDARDDDKYMDWELTRTVVQFPT